MRLSRSTSTGLAGPAVIVLVLFFLAPLVYFLRFSLDRHSLAQVAIPAFTFANFSAFLGTAFYRAILVRTFVIAAISTVGTAVLSFPTAYMLTKTTGRLKSALIILTIFPLMAGETVRAIGWIAILGYGGPLSNLLVDLHLTPNPINVAQTSWGVVVVLISILIPINTLVYQASLEAIDPATERAALDLGASPYAAIRQVVLPQIGPAIITATSLVFVLNVNAFATPLLVSANRVQMLAPEIYSMISGSQNWPLGAAMATVLLIITVAITVLYGWLLRRRLGAWRASA